jgi:hypothetical protein
MRTLITKKGTEYQCHIDDDEQVKCVMLACMSLEIQENMDDHIIIMHLIELFDAASRSKRYKTSKKLFHCKMTEGSSLYTFVLRMIDYFKKLGQLGFVMTTS